MEITNILWYSRHITDTRGKKQPAHLARFSIVSTKAEYRLWMYPANTKRGHDTYSLWRGYGANSPTNAPVFRMECELASTETLAGPSIEEGLEPRMHTFSVLT